jgi:hypothetical protein
MTLFSLRPNPEMTRYPVVTTAEGKKKHKADALLCYVIVRRLSLFTQFARRRSRNFSCIIGIFVIRHVTFLLVLALVCR